MSLEMINQRVGYLAGSNNLGFVFDNKDGAVVIDTGIDKDTGRNVKKALNAAERTLIAIISTHHHADHVGGNDFLLRAYPEAKVYASPVEAALMQNPLFEPIYLSLGATPPKAYRTSWLLSKGTRVDQYVNEGTLTINQLAFEVIALPGHSIQQIGIAIDEVCFAADGFLGPKIVAQHGIPYTHDVAEQLASLDRIAARPERLFLPGHGSLVERDELAAVLEINRDAILKSSATILESLTDAASISAVTANVASHMGRTFSNLAQHAIFQSVVAAHLSYLESCGKAEQILEQGEARWRAL
jgi:glyoxylase-like metal-dependent hydrolase (beta-lactamase superfamily II)